MNTPSSPLNADHSDLTNYAEPESRMRLGKQLVIAGFFVALIGMLLYCVASFSVDTNQQVASTLQADMGWPAVASLGVVGIGTLLWILGAIIYFKGGVDCDPRGPDLYF